MCVCMRERERERESGCVCACVRVWVCASVCVCVCVCVRARAHKSSARHELYNLVRKSNHFVCVCVCLYVCVCLCVCLCVSIKTLWPWCRVVHIVRDSHIVCDSHIVRDSHKLYTLWPFEVYIVGEFNIWTKSMPTNGGDQTADTTHGGHLTCAIWVSRLSSFLEFSFWVTGTPFTQVNPFLRFLGLPRKRVWNVRGLL